jgi:hypothetical protein
MRVVIKYTFLVIVAIAIGLGVYVLSVKAGPYISSSHGNTTYGVNRSSISALGYSRGNCAHCHEQHASINGSEPAPSSGAPSNYALFYDNYVSQTDGVCFQCHTDTGSYQTGGLVNRSYSYRAGGWTTDTLNDILEAFSFTAPGSSHNLDDIKTFIDGRWGYTATSNPCVACHNPHAATGDPANAPNSPKSSTTRGYPIARPSQHSKDTNAWGLWGDDPGEKMRDYTLDYQAPYRYGSTTQYEPDGSTTQDGSNLTDFVTFCTDCHNTVDTIYSTTLARNLRTIDWTQEKHGLIDGNGAVSTDPPYDSVIGKVLACTDCHEPHGSPNQVLIRAEVNGDVLGGTITTIESTDCTPPYSDTNKEIAYLCQRCHMDDYDFNNLCPPNRWYYVHHSSASGDPPYWASSCGSCHASGGGPRGCDASVSSINCNCCHYHGSTDGSGNQTF